MKYNICEHTRIIRNELKKREHIIRKNKLKAFDRLSSIIGLPYDICKKAMHINIWGNNRIQVDNYGKIITCNDNNIILCNCYQKLNMLGNNLKIISYSQTEITIEGIIDELIINK